MKQQSAINKTAWEYRAYEFWNQRDGAPSDKAKEIMADPKASLKKHQDYFQEVTGKRIANLCGRHGLRHLGSQPALCPRACCLCRNRN
ncbi:hypothetical protein [Exiguobacterium sp. s192]|uniref:hypothetical protein n=1 Tax=Exiguobacterium sp. s192 TaxID=2751206 RepID=UPI001BE80603|nr:hypothetical protein [Exiguobacterium sp. s192]